MSEIRWSFPYPSQRMPVLARNVVATSQPLATQAGLFALRRGGNAVDAALAAGIALTVLEPTMNGIGADAFALVWDGGKLHGINGSGRSPAAMTPERFTGLSEMPNLGWDSVTVPGCVATWAQLSKRFGKLPFADLFEAGIHYAREGYPVSPIIAGGWKIAEDRYPDFPEWRRVFTPNGHAPRPGDVWRSEDHARTLEEIAATGGESFYRGALAKRIADCAAAEGGLLSTEDLAAHESNFVEPIGQDYRGYRLHEIPPNGQGLAALIALGILQHFDLAAAPVDSAESIHLQVEAMKLALADAHRYIADPATMDLGWEALLAPEYLAERARLIDRHNAADPVYGTPGKGTVYLTTADASGMMVSFIQSTYWSFGSGVVVPGTGISLQCRGWGFSLEPGHPNRVGPRKRPFHTIIPGFVTQGERPVMSFGVMGGPIQAQGHVQMMVRLADYHQNPQAASDAPRWRVVKGRQLYLESGHPEKTIAELRRRGHEIEIMAPAAFGGAQLAYCLADGYCAASDHRKDGQAAGF